MSVEQHQQAFKECYEGTNDPELKGMADQANGYTQMMKNGQLSKEEYIELMEDIQRRASIDSRVEHQQLLIHMNTAINGLISLAKLV